MASVVAYTATEWVLLRSDRVAWSLHDGRQVVLWREQDRARLSIVGSNSRSDVIYSDKLGDPPKLVQRGDGTIALISAETNDLIWMETGATYIPNGSNQQWTLVPGASALWYSK